MFRLYHMLNRRRINEDPVSVLWHYVSGRMADWENGSDGPILWQARTHRGVQWLNKFEFPRKQKRYIFSPLFEIRYDTQFEEVIRSCAASGMAKENKTWISEPYIRGMVNLHKLGFAHSYEAWNEGKLVGGAFGVQLGSIMTCDSMFHRMSNASKAAYGQTLVRLHERGFKLVDTNGVAEHMVNYGEEWMHQWQYEKLVLQCLGDGPTLTDDRPYPQLPWEIRTMLPMLKITRGLRRRVGRLLRRSAKPTPPQDEGEPKNNGDAQAPGSASNVDAPPAQRPGAA